MESTQINQYIEQLATNLTLSGSYHLFENGSKRMIIVEGDTDKRFINRIKSDDVSPMSAANVFSNEELMDESSDRLSVNAKLAIIGVVYGLSVYPALINTKGLEGWDIYGMIDKDFDASTEHTDSKKLFITDTHDIETLMLSTDKGLLDRITKFILKESDIQKAFFVAYQLGLVRDTFYKVRKKKHREEQKAEQRSKQRAEKKKDLTIKCLNAGVYNIDYGSFVENARINIPGLMRYVKNDPSNCFPNNGVSPESVNTLTKKLIDSLGSKKVDTDGTWKESADTFDYTKVDNFWDIVNGHDILALIKYYNEDANKAYSNSHRRINRDFEIDLIEKYDIEKLKGMNVYANMKVQNIVK